MEKWKDIKDYEGYYQVSDAGNVKSLLFQNNKNNKKYKRDKILKFKGYTPKTGFRVSLWKDGKYKDFLVARLVAFTFYNEDINNRKLTVNHIDGNRMNNNIENLELVSLKDNINHAFENDLMNTNEKIVLIDKKTREAKEFRSMVKASRFLKRNDGYVSCLLKRGQRETKKYEIWSEKHEHEY